MKHCECNSLQKKTYIVCLQTRIKSQGVHVVKTVVIIVVEGKQSHVTEALGDYSLPLLKTSCKDIFKAITAFISAVETSGAMKTKKYQITVSVIPV